jgi:GTPase involved in cell partitioning and DNA repair
LAAELAAYNKDLLKYTHLVVLNKIDCLDEDRVEELRLLFQEIGIEVLALSAQENIGIQRLKELLGDLLEEQRATASEKTEEKEEEGRP